MNFRLVVFFCMFFSACHNDDDLVLRKIEIDNSLEVDTLARYPARGLLIVQLVEHRALGRFSLKYCVVKKDVDKITVYELDNDSSKRISKDFIAIVSPTGKTNWGWFYVSNGKLSDSLPNISSVLKVLQFQKIKKDFVNEVNGYINFYLNGKIVRTFNYGDFVVKQHNIDFDSLDYNLYKLQGGTLKVVSKNGNDIFKQGDGVYFIPSPGYGVLTKYRKKQILDAVDSASKMEASPKILIIKADNN